MVSSERSRCSLPVLMEKKEKKQEHVSITAISDVNSSIRLDSAWLETWNDVITKRQNPSRLAEVLNMCWEVLFAMVKQ